MNIAFFGTPELTLPILDELERAELLPKVIITGEDVRKGRNMEFSSPAPKQWAEARGISILQPQKVDENFLNILKKYEIDLSVVVAYGKILPQSLISLPRLGTVNVHYSLLPKYRGATPVESAILAGDAKTGVVIQKMAFALDSGAVLEKAEVSIGDTETAPMLRERLNEIAKGLLVKAIHDIADESATYSPQNEKDASHCRKIKKEDGLIDINGDAVQNYRKFRAYFGWPGSYFFAEKKGPNRTNGDKSPTSNGASKKMRVIIKEAVLKNGAFEIQKVVPEGKKEMSYKDFLSGMRNW